MMSAVVGILVDDILYTRVTGDSSSSTMTTPGRTNEIDRKGGVVFRQANGDQGTPSE